MYLNSKEPGYIVNISSAGQIKYYKVTTEMLEKLDNKKIMDGNNVLLNSHSYILNQKLFSNNSCNFQLFFLYLDYK